MRPTLAILTTALAVVFSPGDASACCLTDWLCGRSSTPYVVGYAPVPVGMPVAGVAPVSAPVVAARPVVGAIPVSTSGVYQSQRPAYFGGPAVYLDNPSVYTGMPVTGNVQTSYRVAAPSPFASPIPSTVVPSGPIVSSRVVTPAYPAPATIAPTNTLNYRGQAPVTTYRPQVDASIPGAPITVPTPTGTPATGIPTTPVAPVFTTPPPQPRGFRGFFSRLFGTGYRTSYYSAPVTYYRPVTTVDPVSGAPVVVQQPCTSTVQQLQRTPFQTVQSIPTTAPAPACASPSCATPGYMSPGYQQATPVYPPPSSGFAQPIPGAVGQVGGVGAMGTGAAPIPSTIGPGTYPSGSVPPSGNLTPLQGSPPSSGDLAPIDRPETDRVLAPPPLGTNGSQVMPPVGSGEGATSDGSTTPSSTPSNSGASPSNYWELQNAEDSTAMIQPRANRGLPSDPNSLTSGGVEPIAAPDDYISPFRSRSAPPVTQPQAGTMQAPPLPARSTYDPGELTAVSTRSSKPYRAAATQAANSIQRSVNRVPQSARRVEGSRQAVEGSRRATVWYANE